MRLHYDPEIAPGHVVVSQADGILFCRLAELIYEPGDDADTDMIVNPVDVDAAKATWFEDKGSVQ